MGGGTFVDGVRRLFQRRSAFVANNISSNDEQQHQPHAVLTEQQTLSIVVDFDISGLKLIKVPKRINFPLPNSSMDSHKKVAFLPPLLLSGSRFLDSHLYGSVCI